MDKQRLRRGAFPVATWAILALAGATAIAGCKKSSTGGGVTPNSIITIVPSAFNKGMMAFSPASDTVRVGNLVRLHNGDSITHNIQTVTPNGPTWGTISGGTDRDVTVTVAGTFAYQCVIASHAMSGQIVVLP